MSDFFSRAKEATVDLFKQSHAHSDVDADRDAYHHTLGSNPTQAAPGNHKHSNGEVAVGEATAVPFVTGGFVQINFSSTSPGYGKWNGSLWSPLGEGTYLCSVNLRLPDAMGPTQLGFGVHTSTADNPNFMWQEAGGIAGGGRHLLQYSRIAILTPSDVLRLFYYTETPFTSGTIYMAITKLS